MADQQVTITVAQATPPAPGKARWTLKDTANMQYYYDGSKLFFEIGKTYVINIYSNEFKGRTYYNVSSIISEAGGGAAPPQQAAPQAAPQRSPAFPIPQYQQPAPPQAPPPQMHGGFPPTDYVGAPMLDSNALIFITGVVGRFMGSGNFNPDMLPEITREALAAWREIIEPELRNGR